MGSSSSDTLFKTFEPLEEVSFTINGKPYTVKPDGTKITLTTTLNTFIRNVAQLKGTKLMCLEGGCGSCVVTAEFAHPVTKREVTVAVNSCLVTILSCDGWKITTVEGIGNKKIGYNVVQKRLADFNGTQCGFCSPGMVMNMYSLLSMEGNGLTQKQVENAFGGNICRCTGYRSIADGFKTLATDADPKLLAKCHDLEELNICSKTGTFCAKQCEKKNRINESAPQTYIYICMDNEKWFKVFKLSELLEVLKDIGDEKYMLVAGNTAHGVIRRDTDIVAYIDVNSVEELHSVSISDKELILGANTTLTEAMKIFMKVSNEKPGFSYLTEITTHWDLVANVPVRNMGTIAGNLALKHSNNRFQSDIFLTLETFGAKLRIDSKDGSPAKIVSPKEFLQLDMKGQVLVSVTLYPLEGNYVFQTYKIMPRAQNTHAIVNAGFCMKLSDDKTTVTKADVVYGAINENFVHANETEKLLLGKNLFDDATLQDVYKSLENELICDVAPTDPSPEARKQLAINLFYKFILNTAPENLVNVNYKSGGTKFDRPVSTAKQDFDTKKDTYPLTQPIPKVEALVQCAGEAKYIIDVDTSRADYTFSALILARAVPGSLIQSINSNEAMKIPGVIDVITSKDVPGRNCYNVPELLYNSKTEIFCESIVKYNGQPVGLVIAETEEIAQKAAKLVSIEYEAHPSTKQNTYTIRDALKLPDNSRIKLEGNLDPTSKGDDIKHVIKGTFDIGGQYHFTMETQTCVCIPIEDGMDIYSSTQWMDYIQTAIAKSCNIPSKNINLNVRRIGGGYGAKISVCSLIACATAVAATKLNRPVYSRMTLEDNMESIGKRYPCSADYEVGVNDDGKIQYLKLSIWMNYGYIANEPNANEVLQFLVNYYDTQTWDVKAYGVLTDISPNTYCRAPSSTEALALIESIMEHIAVNLKKDPEVVRLQNAVKDNPLPDLVKDFNTKADIELRKSQIKEFNMNNRWKKRAIGQAVISFSFQYYGNFYAMVSVYTGDGTVSITHGGIEMGQGINTKVQQVAAYTLGIDLDMIQIKPTNVLTSPNNGMTAGSVGSESVCYATMEACKVLLNRLAPVRKEMKEYNWVKMIQLSNQFGVDLNAQYQFSPSDNVKNYDIYGVTYTEVEVDLLTGLVQINRVDLLEDTGESMSPEIDIGQVEGAFVMGIGYWLMEHIEIDESDGKLLNTRTWTYHPPGLKDIPIDWRIDFRKNAPNPVGVLRSKATGEPPLCMSVSVAFAIRNALFEVRSENNPTVNPWFPFDGPTSTDSILLNSLLHYKDFKLK